MSFGDLLFAEGHVGINTRNVPKVHKKHNKINTRHETKGEKAHYQQIRGPKRQRTRPNPSQNISTLCNTTVG